MRSEHDSTQRDAPPRSRITFEKGRRAPLTIAYVSHWNGVGYRIRPSSLNRQITEACRVDEGDRNPIAEWGDHTVRYPVRPFRRRIYLDHAWLDHLADDDERGSIRTARENLVQNRTVDGCDIGRCGWFAGRPGGKCGTAVTAGRVSDSADSPNGNQSARFHCVP